MLLHVLVSPLAWYLVLIYTTMDCSHVVAFTLLVVVSTSIKYHFKGI